MRYFQVSSWSDLIRSPLGTNYVTDGGAIVPRRIAHNPVIAWGGSLGAGERGEVLPDQLAAARLVQARLADVGRQLRAAVGPVRGNPQGVTLPDPPNPVQAILDRFIAMRDQ